MFADRRSAPKAKEQVLDIGIMVPERVGKEPLCRRRPPDRVLVEKRHPTLLSNSF
jgi:hypothetical protein